MAMQIFRAKICKRKERPSPTFLWSLSSLGKQELVSRFRRLVCIELRLVLRFSIGAHAQVPPKATCLQYRTNNKDIQKSPCLFFSFLQRDLKF